MVRLALIAPLLFACGARTPLDDTKPDADVDVNDEQDSGLTTDGPTVLACAISRTQLVSAQLAAGIVIDASFVYYRTPEGLWRVAKSGGVPTFIGAMGIAGSSLLSAFTLDTTDVYYGAADGGLVRAAKQGAATPQPLGLYAEQLLVSVDSTNVYAWSWKGSTTLFRLPLGGGTLTKVTTTLPSSVNFISIDESGAFLSADQDGLFLIDLSNGDIQNISQRTAWNVVIDATYAYFTTGNDGSGVNAVLQVTRNGATTTTITTANYAFALALDTENIYYTDVFEGTVRRVAKTGGDSAAIYSQSESFPMAVAVDDVCVYWTTVAGISAAPKL